jgi:outer membrane protein OmpA-like peptidoglycan-associated protein
LPSSAGVEMSCFWISIEGQVVSSREWIETTTSVSTDNRGNIQSSTTRDERSDVLLEGAGQQHRLKDIVYGARTGQQIRIDFLRQSGGGNLFLILRELLASPRDARMSAFSGKAPPNFRGSISRGAVVTNLATREVDLCNPHRSLEVFVWCVILTLGLMLIASTFFSSSARTARTWLLRRKEAVETQLEGGLAPGAIDDQLERVQGRGWGIWPFAAAMIAAAMAIFAVNSNRLSSVSSEVASSVERDAPVAVGRVGVDSPSDPSVQSDADIQRADEGDEGNVAPKDMLAQTAPCLTPERDEIGAPQSNVISARNSSITDRLSAGGFTFTRVDARQLILPDLVTFDQGRDEVCPWSVLRLRELGRILADHDGFIEVHSYVRPMGSRTDSQDLSERRAVNAGAVLISAGVDRSNLVAQGFGDSADDDRLEILIF